MRMRQKHTKKLIYVVALSVLALGVGVFFSGDLFAAKVWRLGHPTLAYYLNHSDATLALQEANYFFGTKAYDLHKAKHAYQLALKLDPEAPLAHYQLARIHFVEGDLVRAFQEINFELITNPQNLRALYVRGLIVMTQGDLFAAENDFKRFVAWAPTEWGGYNDLAYVQAKQGKYKESEQTIGVAMSKVPGAEQVPWLWNSLGLAQLNQFKYKEAEASFKRALDLANRLMVDEWRRAYTANDPAGDAQSVEAFRAAIAKNLVTAQAR